jgi:hypothetical protein
MKPSTSIRLGVLTLALTTLGAALAACSSNSANPSPGPTVFDSGADRSVAKQPDGSMSHPDGGSTHSPDGTVGTPDTSAGMDVVVQIEATLPDVGSCKSDASTCNSCFTVQQNPLNACSPATVDCIPFDNTRVPAGAP